MLVEGTYGQRKTKTRYSTVVTDYIDMLYLTADVEKGLKQVLGLDSVLAVTVTANEDEPLEGGNVTFTVTVANTGTQSGVGISVAFPIPAGLTYASKVVPGGTTYDQATGAWVIGTIAASGSKVLAVTVTADVISEALDIEAVATLTSVSTSTYVYATDTDSVDINPGEAHADLEFHVTADDLTPAVAGHVIYTLTVKNNGPLPATSVVASCPVPAGTTFSAKTVTAPQTYVEGTGVWTIGSIAVDATKTLAVDVTVNTGQEGLTITGGGQITGCDQLDDVAGNYNDSVDVVVDA